MDYKKINLFGKQKSRGTYDDFYNTEKYDTIEQAYEANDYVECDFVRDHHGDLYIEAKNVKNPDRRIYHRLHHQRPVAGLDVYDDEAGCELAESLL